MACCLRQLSSRIRSREVPTDIREFPSDLTGRRGRLPASRGGLSPHLQNDCPPQFQVLNQGQLPSGVQVRLLTHEFA